MDYELTRIEIGKQVALPTVVGGGKKKRGGKNGWMREFQG